jgi:uncharacterized protein YecE (DUF72 family)
LRARGGRGRAGHREDGGAGESEPPHAARRTRGRRNAPGRVRVGISGYAYPRWRGAFYPADLPARGWLAYAARTFDSIEINATFYRMATPAAFRRWVEETPSDCRLAVKGSRFITHNLKLARAETALANFYASGVLELGRKTGPFLWQLPPRLRFDAERVTRFLELLPRDSAEAEALARGHDDRVREPCLRAAARVRYRHAFEVRHPSFLQPAFYEMLRAHGCALVVADSAGVHPYSEEVTAPFVYVRLHGSRELYVSGYEDAEITVWARRIRTWAVGLGLDVYAYFDNDAKVHAPRDALRLADALRRLGIGTGRGTGRRRGPGAAGRS